MTRERLLETLKSNLNQFRRYGVERIGLFGSFARSEEQFDSDIDILVIFSENKKSFDNLMELKFHLDELFPDNNVDLVVDDALKPRIKTAVDKEVVYVS